MKSDLVQATNVVRAVKVTAAQAYRDQSPVRPDRPVRWHRHAAPAPLKSRDFQWDLQDQASLRRCSAGAASMRFIAEACTLTIND
jgi:hypothetical protein